jgi:hypothetical protein
MREVRYPFGWFVHNHAEVVQKVLSLRILNVNKTLLLDFIGS